VQAFVDWVLAETAEAPASAEAAPRAASEEAAG
jgi:hypothetical protein